LSLKLNQKGGFIIMLILMLLIELCEVLYEEVFKCRERRVMRWDEVWKKAQAWGFPCQPKKYPRGTSVKACVMSQHVGQLWGRIEGFCAFHLKLRDFFALLLLKPKSDWISLWGGMVNSRSVKDLDMTSFDQLLVGNN
jgi:hypothetical protein